jgi:riboflavin kinase/FMN adenylyltransferase
MQTIDTLSQADLPCTSFVTVGSYDGIHIGHQRLLNEMKQAAEQDGHCTVVITFYPRPRMVLTPDIPARYLTPPAEKLALLEQMGIDLTAVLHFTSSVAQMTPESFIEEMITHLHMRELWVGPNFALGRQRTGDIPRLRQLGKQHGFVVRVVQPLILGGAMVSSTRIRNLLEHGQIREATTLLGRYPSLNGQVVAGDRRGRTMGFPTANIQVSPESFMPVNGVYACFVWIGQDRYLAVANIGTRPTFDGSQHTVEVHLLNYERDLYGLHLKLDLVEFLRPETQFGNMNALANQIKTDVQRAARLLLDELGLNSDVTRPGL